jgi:hypothetical protein
MSGNRVEARRLLAEAVAGGAKPEDLAILRASIGTGYALLSLADAVEDVARTADEAAAARRDAAIRETRRLTDRARRWRWVPKALRPAEVRRWSA